MAGCLCDLGGWLIDWMCWKSWYADFKAG